VTGKADPDSKVTVTDKDGNPVPGCEDITPDATGRFECVPDVKLNPGDSITVVATDRAGNKSKPVTVKIGALGIEVAHPKRYHGEEQIVSGKNFNPGENVSLVIYSDPFEVGTAVADKDGKVTFKFAVPETLEYGQHTATLTGEESGDASTTFEVIAKPVVPTGGTTIPGSSLPLMLMAMGALMAFVGFQVFPRIQRNK
jgi:adhesin/invasin